MRTPSKGEAMNVTRSLAAIVLSVFITTTAVAQNLGTIYTDDWWNPNESGWGLIVAHQQNFMFATFFIYRADGSPYWVTGQLQKVGTGGLGTFPQVFTGPLYETSGPPFGNPFNSAPVTIHQVGTVTFSAPSFLNATLQYSINGVNVTKSVERQTLSNVNYSGQYLGGTAYQLSQCVPSRALNNGTTVTDTGVLTVFQSGTSFQMTAAGQTTNCSFIGNYSQQGSIGRVDGNFSCSDATAGTFTMVGMQWTLFGMSSGIAGRSQFCTFTGSLGGITGTRP
jgi:hypothetical protein